MTVGSIPRHLVNFATPMLLGNLLQALYNTVDTIWVGRFLGPQSLAAVSVSFPVIFVLVSMIMGIAMATTVLVAQNAGAKRMDMVRRVIGNSLALLVIGGVGVSAVGLVFHRTVLQMINVPPEIMPQASQYLSIFLGGLIFMFAYNTLSAIMRGLGDSRTPLTFLIYATVMNIILDPLMIFGVWPFPPMGVAGAAIATVASQAFSGVLAVRYLLRKTDLLSTKLKDYRIEKDLTVTTVKIGLPVGIQQTVMSLGTLVVSSVINSFGGTVVAGFGAGARVDHFIIMPAMSISMAVSSVVGQNLGAQKQERVHETLKWAIVLSVSIAALFTAAILAVPRVLVSPFTTDAQVLSVGSSYLRIMSLSYIPFAIMFATNGVMRGAGDTLPTMIISITTLWLVRVPLARYLSSLPGLKENGIWWAMVASTLMGMTLSIAYYRTGRWKKRRLIQPAVEANQP
jgi:putative MATE family efflux protein